MKKHLLICALIGACTFASAANYTYVPVAPSGLVLVKSDDCPKGYIPITGSDSLGTTNFCVAKYEMRQGSSGPVSQPEGQPWVNISAEAAFSACAGVTESGFDGKFSLITNPQWMTIARNLESVGSNWSGGATGSGVLARGWSAGSIDGFVNTRPAVNSNSACEYNTGANACGISGQHQFRRTMTMSNGEVIWDLSANVYEWTDWHGNDNQFSLGPKNCPNGPSELTASLSCGLSTNDYKPTGDFDSRHNAGRLYADPGKGGAASRGFRWLDEKYTGIYGLNLTKTAQDALPLIGFRCVYQPKSSTVPSLSAKADSFAVINNKNTQIDILSNDTWQGSTSVTIKITSHKPDSGTAIVNGNSITYQPKSGSTGDDWFEYQLSDQTGRKSNIARVTINIIDRLLPMPVLGQRELTFDNSAQLARYQMNWAPVTGASHYLLQYQKQGGVWQSKTVNTTSDALLLEASTYQLKLSACITGGCEGIGHEQVFSVDASPVFVQLDKPRISPLNSRIYEFEKYVKVTLASDQPGVGFEYFLQTYTVSGERVVGPTKIYTGPFIIDDTVGQWVRVWAKAKKAGWRDSALVAHSYTICKNAPECSQYDPEKRILEWASSTVSVGQPVNINWDFIRVGECVEQTTDFAQRVYQSAAHGANFVNRGTEQRRFTKPGAKSSKWYCKQREYPNPQVVPKSGFITIDLQVTKLAAPQSHNLVLESKVGNQGRYTVSWASVEGASGYELQYRQGNNAWQSVKSSGTSQSILLNSGLYEFVLSACIAEGCEGIGEQRRFSSNASTDAVVATRLEWSPAEVVIGQAATLSWTFDNAGSCADETGALIPLEGSKSDKFFAIGTIEKTFTCYKGGNKTGQAYPFTLNGNKALKVKKMPAPSSLRVSQ